jgi:hypothetical protein
LRARPRANSEKQQALKAFGLLREFESLTTNAGKAFHRSMQNLETQAPEYLCTIIDAGPFRLLDENYLPVRRSDEDAA